MLKSHCVEKETSIWVIILLFRGGSVMGFEFSIGSTWFTSKTRTKNPRIWDFGHQVVDWLKLLLKLDSPLAGTCAHHRYSNSKVSTQSVLLEWNSCATLDRCTKRYGTRRCVRYSTFSLAQFWVRIFPFCVFSLCLFVFWFSQSMNFIYKCETVFGSHSHTTVSVYKKPLNAIVMPHDLLSVAHVEEKR